MKNPLVRVIGDNILHQSGKVFPHKPTKEQMKELQVQVTIAKEMLISTGGAGIAANQCASIAAPYRFTIVGVFYENDTHVENVERRYPGVKFPQATLMINPRIIFSSEDKINFPHGCLSVPGTIRAEIETPRTIEVEFETLDTEENLRTQRKIASNNDAVVLQHELNHILHGKTYIDCCFDALPSIEVEKLKTLLIQEFERRRSPEYKSEFNLKHPDFYRFIIVGSDGNSKLDYVALDKALKFSINTQTLIGLIQRIELKQEKSNQCVRFKSAPDKTKIITDLGEQCRLKSSL